MKTLGALMVLALSLLLSFNTWADNSCPSGYTDTECQSMGLDRGSCPSGYTGTECESMGYDRQICPPGYTNTECESMGLTPRRQNGDQSGTSDLGVGDSSRQQCRRDLALIFQNLIKRDFRGTDAYALPPNISEWQGNVAKIYDTVVDPTKDFRAVAVYEVFINPNCTVIGNVKRDL